MPHLEGRPHRARGHARTTPGATSGTNEGDAMKLEAVCDTCGRTFLLAEILPSPEGTGADFLRRLAAELENPERRDVSA